MAFHLAWAITHIGGHRVRTGAADGIDTIAMRGTRGKNLDVYLPWASYNRDSIPTGANVIVFNPSIHLAWIASVARYHPSPGVLGVGARALHARNFGIVSECVGIIALPRNDGGGGTGQGIRIAQGLGITIVQGNRGSIADAPRFIGRALQILGLADPSLATTLQGRK